MGEWYAAQYKLALSEKKIEAAKTVALDYYVNTVWQIEKISTTVDSNSRYNNTGLEMLNSAYKYLAITPPVQENLF